MTITNIIEKIENAINGLEDMIQIPEDNRSELINNLEAIAETLGEYADDYGEDPSYIDEETQDNEDI